MGFRVGLTSPLCNSNRRLTGEKSEHLRPTNQDEPERQCCQKNLNHGNKVEVNDQFTANMALSLSAYPPSGIGRGFRTRCSIFARPAQRAKRNLLELISDQDRGLRTQKDSGKRDAIVNAIECMAVIGRSSTTTGDSLSATWRLLWTTEKEQLFIIEKAGLFGTRAGDVLQVIDVQKRMLSNVITFPPDGVFFVRSDIDIASPQRVNFRFSSAVLRGRNWEIPLPPFGQGWFETVYMDGEIRVAKDIRGDYLIVDRAPFNWKE